jgi:hypothetical protein
MSDAEVVSVPSPEGGGTAASGDCFVVAGEAVVTHGAAGEVVRLIHARVTGTGPTEGVVHWHAWVEVTARHRLPTWDGHTVEVMLTLAVDRSNGHDVAMPAELYRKLARIDGEVLEYDPSDAMMWMLQSGTYGPWENDREDWL